MKIFKMDFDSQILIAMLVALAVGLPLTVYMGKKYAKKGKSVRLLPIKIGLCVTLPILSVPILLKPDATCKDYFGIVIMGVFIVLYVTSSSAIRKSLGKDD